MEPVLNDFKNLLHMELKKLNQKGTVTPSEVESAYKAVCILEKIAAIDTMEQGGDYLERHSGAPYGYHNMPHMNGNYYPMSHGYDWDDNSQRRGRGMDGRYTSRGGMSADGGRSGHGTKDKMLERLERMRDEATSEQERYEIQQEIDRIRMGN